jgi:hypothetical protein
LGFEVWSTAFGVKGYRGWVQGLGFGVWGMKFRGQRLSFGVEGSGCRVQGSRLKV